MPLPEIEGIVWMKSAEEFMQLRSSLAAFKNFWLFSRGLYLSSKNYQRIGTVLGHDCPEFTRNDALFSSLTRHMNSLDTTAVLTAMRNRINAIARTGEYKI
jgi:hypothetical protein